jgi:hypothetical protein
LWTITASFAIPSPFSLSSSPPLARWDLLLVNLIHLRLGHIRYWLGGLLRRIGALLAIVFFLYLRNLDLLVNTSECQFFGEFLLLLHVLFAYNNVDDHK